MNKYYIVAVMLGVTSFCMRHVSAQKLQDGIAGVQVGGFDKYGRVNSDFYAVVRMNPNLEKDGIHAFLASNFRLQPNQSPWAFFAVGCGVHIPFKTPPVIPSKSKFNSKVDTLLTGFIDCGGAVGFQTRKEDLVRGMVYFGGFFPIKIKRRHLKDGYSNHPVIVSGIFDFSKDSSSYRYRASAVFQVTDSRKDINLLIGAHAERYMAIGPTLQLHIGPTRGAQIFAVCGINLDNKDTYGNGTFSGGIGFMGRW